MMMSMMLREHVLHEMLGESDDQHDGDPQQHPEELQHQPHPLPTLPMGLAQWVGVAR